MENIYPSNLEQVLFKDLNREVLYKLFINSNAQSMDVDEIGMIDEGVQSSPKEREVRHRVEKLLFLNLLPDSSHFFFKFIPISICFDSHF